MMLSLLSVALLLVAHAQADVFRGSPRIWAREGTFSNSTARTANTSTIISTSFSTSSSTSSLNSKPSSSLTSGIDISGVLVIPTTSSTRSLNTTTSTPEPTCAGSVTYTGSVYPTVFITVTQGFDVTVTASDAPVTHSATLVTPLPACQATVISAAGSVVSEPASGATPIATIAVSTISVLIDSAGAGTATATGDRGAGVGPDHPNPANPTDGGSPANISPVIGESESFSTLYSTVYGSAPYTSTVVVTKKTPVTVVVPPSSNPPVFQNPTSSTKAPATPGTSHQNNPGNGGQAAAGTSSLPPNNPVPAPSPKPNGDANGGPSIPSPTAGIVTATSKSTGPANANSPVVAAQPDAVAPATTIHSVPVAVGASSVLVGTQAVAIPTSGAATVRAGDQLFTVKASEIVASGTTVEYKSLELAQMVTAAAPTRVTAAPGVVVTVQGTTAVVAGTTYRIGQGASATTLTVSGQTIQLGPSGVVLASTTVPAGPVTPVPMAVESVGSMTFSVDASEVVIEGTTYRIGSGAPTIRTTVDGQSLSIGPGGVAVGTKTTLKPTSITADLSGMITGTGMSTATATTGVQAAVASHPFRTMAFSEVFGWLLVTLISLLV